jgi:threonine dehydrogenase-like Zn-dependent dehydrogenase
VPSARAFWTVGPGRGEIREESVAPPRAGEVLVETLYSGISRGTESLVFAGRVPPADYARMRAPHMAGAFPFPVKYGYLNVGRVVATGEVGFCLYPHQTSYVVPAEDLIVLPAGVEPARAVLAGNVETAINCIWDAEVRVGDRVLVVGAGVVGSLVAYVASHIAGCQVTLVDVMPERARVAAALGVAFATPDSARKDADVIVHASGAPAGLATAVSLARSEATVVELSCYGEAAPTAARSIRSSQVGRLSPAQQARWTPHRRLALAVSLLTDPALDVLIDGEVAFEDLPKVLPGLQSALCRRVRYH